MYCRPSEALALTLKACARVPCLELKWAGSQPSSNLDDSDEVLAGVADARHLRVGARPLLGLAGRVEDVEP
eukprot:9818762-Alexandrium_andersonii.AAC.1